MAMPRAYPTNRLSNSLAYPKIMHAYNELLQRDGRVNNKKFYENIISKEIPNYTLTAWYQFVKRFKSEAGLIAPKTFTPSVALSGGSSAEISEQETAITILSNNDALQRSIAHALNISAHALKDVMENPELISAEKRAELFLKVMKAQDSRVKAIGMMKADNREQERFERAMDNAAFS